MAREIKMNEPDLPEPAPKSWSLEERRLRQWSLAVLVMTFIAIYALLHKVFIPVTLKLTSLKTSPYSQIDPGFFLPVSLVFLLRRADHVTKALAFLAGIAIVYGAYEIFEVFQGRYVGWLAFSRLLSSVPLAGGCIYLMSQRKFKGDLSISWIGAVTFLLVAGVLEVRKAENFVSHEAPSKVAPAVPRFQDAVPQCGAIEFSIPPGTRAETPRVIRISDCGLSPAIIVETSARKLEFVNEKSESVNLHLVSAAKGKRWHTEWNISIPPKTSVQSRVFKLPAKSVGMLYSDSTPSVGIIAILPSDLPAAWHFQRKPIRVE
jgi:hypothetical protein